MVAFALADGAEIARLSLTAFVTGHIRAKTAGHPYTCECQLYTLSTEHDVGCLKTTHRIR